jgi:hypothetical protein
MDIEKIIDISKDTMNFNSHRIQLNVPKINCEILYNTYRALLKESFSIKQIDISHDISDPLSEISNIMECLITYNTIFKSDLKNVIEKMRTCASMLDSSHASRSDDRKSNGTNIISFLLAEDNFRDSWESYIENILVEVNDGPCIVNNIRRIHMLVEKYNQHLSIPIPVVLLTNHIICNFIKNKLDIPTQANFIMRRAGVPDRSDIMHYQQTAKRSISEAAATLISTPTGLALYKGLCEENEKTFMTLNHLDCDYVQKTFDCIKKRLSDLLNDSEGNIDVHPLPTEAIDNVIANKTTKPGKVNEDSDSGVSVY